MNSDLEELEQGQAEYLLDDDPASMCLAYFGKIATMFDAVSKDINSIKMEVKKTNEEIANVRTELNKFRSKMGRLLTSLDVLHGKFEESEKLFPLASESDMEQVEKKIQENPAFKTSIDLQIEQLCRGKGAAFIGELVTDELLNQYNISGRGSRKSIMTYYIVTAGQKIANVDRFSLGAKIRGVHDRKIKKEKYVSAVVKKNDMTTE